MKIHEKTAWLAFLGCTLALGAQAGAIEQESGTYEMPEVCSPVNFYEDPASPLWQIPIYDQNPSATCYAYASAQLVDFQLKRYQGDPLKGNISPAYFAFKHKEYSPWLENLYVKGAATRKSLEVSIARRAIEDLTREGICKPEAVTRSLGAFTEGTNVTEGELIYLVEKYWHLSEKFGVLAESPYYDQITTQLASDEDAGEWLDIMGAYRRNFSAAASYVAPARADALAANRSSEAVIADRKRTLETLRPVLERIIHRSPKSRDLTAFFRFFRQELFSECKGQNIVPLEVPQPESIGRWYAPNRKVLNAIDQAIQFGNPAALGYCAKVYETEPGTVKRKWLLPRGLRSAVESGCGPHYSLIVGRRMHKENGCEYLLRNSKATRFWTKNRECLCQTPDGKLESCRADPMLPIDHDNSKKVLGCWLDESSIANSAFDVEWYIPQKP